MKILGVILALVAGVGTVAGVTYYSGIVTIDSQAESLQLLDAGWVSTIDGRKEWIFVQNTGSTTITIVEYAREDGYNRIERFINVIIETSKSANITIQTGVSSDFTLRLTTQRGHVFTFQINL